MISIEFNKNNKYSIAYDNETKIGICEFIENDDCWNIVHTEVSKLYQGQGIAKKLVKSIIKNAEKNNKKIIADCSYAKKIIERG